VTEDDRDVVGELLDRLHERHGRRLCQLSSGGDESRRQFLEARAATLELRRLIIRLEDGDLGAAVDDEYRGSFRALSQQRVALERAKLDERREEQAEPEHVGREVS
jgi:hypothetical protein